MDHRLSVYRPSIVRDEVTRREEREYSVEAEGLAAGVQSDRRSLMVLQPGEAQVGAWSVYLRMDEDEVFEGDVLDITDGPESPRKLEVMEAYRPRRRFQQIKARNFEGAL
jgi:hypothetical protein